MFWYFDTFLVNETCLPAYVVLHNLHTKRQFLPYSFSIISSMAPDFHLVYQAQLVQTVAVTPNIMGVKPGKKV